eukprot:COSAG03_NODE_431_length_7966_cov_4.105123_3_plen_85_part_00
MATATGKGKQKRRLTCTLLRESALRLLRERSHDTDPRSGSHQSRHTSAACARAFTQVGQPTQLRKCGLERRMKARGNCVPTHSL